MNNVVLVGRLVRDLELRYILEYGILVVIFVLVVDRGYVKKDGIREVDFILIEVMGGLVEFCVNYFIKGRMVLI